MVVRELLTRLGFSIDKKPLHDFEKSVESIRHGLEGLKGALEVVGVGLSAYGAFEFFKGAAEASNQILNVAQKVGIGVESLQRLKYAAEFSDLSLEALSGGLKFLNKNFVEAQDGSKEATKAFQEVLGKGFNPKQYKSTEQLLLAVSDRFHGMQDGAKKTALSMKILGRAGADMIPFLNTGSEAIRRQGDELEALGGVLGVEALKSGEEFNNGLHRMQVFFVSLRNTIAARFFPAINGLIDRFVEFLKQNRAVIRERFDHYLNAIARVGQFLLTVAEFLLKEFDGLAESLGSVEGAIIATTIAFAAFGVVTGLVSVVTLAILALAAAIFLLWDDYQTFVDGGDALIKWPDWIRAIKVEFEAVSAVLSKIKEFFEFFIANPIGDFVAKAWTNDFMNNKLAKARSRSDMQDQRQFGDFPQLTPENFFNSGGGLPPLLDTPAPPPSVMQPPPSGAQQNNDVSISQAITVNVQSSADPEQIAEQVRSITREENEKSWLDTHRALQPGAAN